MGVTLAGVLATLAGIVTSVVTIFKGVQWMVENRAKRGFGATVLLGTSLILVVLLVTGVLGYGFVQATKNTPLGQPLVLASGTPTATPLPTATPVPPRVITENLQIPCTSPYCPISVVLDTVTIDTAHQRMLWKFTITNTGNSGTSNIRFNQLQLEDPTARTYTATGQAQDTWNLGPGASIDETPTFNFVPQPGTEYKLLLQIYGTGFADSFQTEAFTF